MNLSNNPRTHLLAAEPVAHELQKSDHGRMRALAQRPIDQHDTGEARVDDVHEVGGVEARLVVVRDARGSLLEHVPVSPIARARAGVEERMGGSSSKRTSESERRCLGSTQLTRPLRAVTDSPMAIGCTIVKQAGTTEEQTRERGVASCARVQGRMWVGR